MIDKEVGKEYIIRKFKGRVGLVKVVYTCINRFKGTFTLWMLSYVTVRLLESHNVLILTTVKSLFYVD